MNGERQVDRRKKEEEGEGMKKKEKKKNLPVMASLRL